MFSVFSTLRAKLLAPAEFLLIVLMLWLTSRYHVIPSMPSLTKSTGIARTGRAVVVRLPR